MKSSIIVAVIVIAALAATGAAMNAIMPGGESPTPGGLRAVAADLAWLRANSAWEQRDPARTRTWLNLVVALDPRPAYFWINGARM
ncbi:MAG TPA: hypothetical protein VG710_07455, partial [Opitutus sp.]|nr:hypothetical protein [Opitutus sp.]